MGLQFPGMTGNPFVSFCCEMHFFFFIIVIHVVTFTFLFPFVFPTESTELSKCFARQGIKIPIRKESRFKRPTDRFYGANNSYSLNASPLKEGSSKASKIDEKFTSPDDEDEIDADDLPITTTADISTAENDVSRQAEPSTSTSKESAEESPIPYKRLSISSYLSAQRD